MKAKLCISGQGYHSGFGAELGEQACEEEIYWVGPIIGAVLAGVLYEYIYCPDIEFKQQLKDAFSKATQKTRVKYQDVDDNQSQADHDDLILKTGTVNVIDPDRGRDRKAKDTDSEILSTV
ncbi:hypothetical protein NDU88_001092 [Pleurodeles waltl]|uniref:Uncharacterized protein n=1 Tax=Pleurodeles waltl TaxID=8319 RepID=A0AAV7UVX4_PLEWA|nr:hypothetical protein NDU88_001092 [Pleurodeles waltl]